METPTTRWIKLVIPDAQTLGWSVASSFAIGLLGTQFPIIASAPWFAYLLYCCAGPGVVMILVNLHAWLTSATRRWKFHRLESLVDEVLALRDAGHHDREEDQAALLMVKLRRLGVNVNSTIRSGDSREAFAHLRDCMSRFDLQGAKNAGRRME